MKSPIPDYLQEISSACASVSFGHNADYIPELARIDPTLFGLALCTVDGKVYSSGDVGVEFTVQSVSKPFIYAMALEDRGFETVARHIGVEPSGEAFNEISLEAGSKRPRNAMINAGAIAAHSLLVGREATADERVARVIEGLSRFAGRDLSVNHVVAESEWNNAHRNLAIGHMLRSYDILTQDPDQIVHGYIQQCAVNVTARDLAVMATTFANGGVQPVTGEQVVSPQVARQVMSVMLSCGMYNAAGDWLTTVGIPAKSGVAGAIIGALPGQLGVATYSPPLDGHGHSVRGVRAFERLSKDMAMHLMDVPPPARSVIRYSGVFELVEARPDDDVEPMMAHIYDLQGDIRFAGAERVVRLVVDEPPTEELVVFDFMDVHALDATAQRVLLEIMRRLDADGHDVWLIGFDIADDALREHHVRAAETLTEIAEAVAV